MFTHNDFKDFYDMGSELDNNYISAQDKICFLFLQRVPATMQNFADLYDGFCSASVQAGVVPMCLENIIRLDRENFNWLSGDKGSEPLPCNFA